MALPQAEPAEVALRGVQFFHALDADFFALARRQSRPLEIGVFADGAGRVIMAPQE